MVALRRLFSKLRLRVNESKSAQDRKFLGDSFWYAKGGEVKRRVAGKALVAMQDRVRGITKRSGGRNISSVIAGGVRGSVGDYPTVPTRFIATRKLPPS